MLKRGSLWGRDNFTKLESSITIFTDRSGSWRDSSAVTTMIGYSSKGPEFNSQHLRGGSEPSITESGALFCHADVYREIEHSYTYTNKSLERF